jgi:hypothetical protein
VVRLAVSHKIKIDFDEKPKSLGDSCKALPCDLQLQNQLLRLFVGVVAVQCSVFIALSRTPKLRATCCGWMPLPVDGRVTFLLVEALLT